MKKSNLAETMMMRKVTSVRQESWINTREQNKTLIMFSFELRFLEFFSLVSAPTFNDIFVFYNSKVCHFQVRLLFTTDLKCEKRM